MYIQQHLQVLDDALPVRLLRGVLRLQAARDLLCAVQLLLQVRNGALHLLLAAAKQEDTDWM